MKYLAAKLAYFSLLGLTALPGAAQVQLIAHTSATNNLNGTGTINTTGANFYAVCETGPYGPVVPTDSVGSNNYVLLATANNPGYWSVYLYVSYNPTTSTAERWSVNGGTYPATVEAFSGVASADKTAAANGALPLVIPSVTPTNPNELILSCFQPQAGSVSSPLAIVDSTGGYDGITAAYTVQTVPTTLGVDWVEPAGDVQTNAGVTASFYSTLSPAVLSPTALLQEGFVGVNYSYQLTATGGVAPYTWTLSSGSLPGGLSLSSAGLISGKPTTTALNAPLTFTVTDSQGTKASTAGVTLTIGSSPLSISTTTCPGGTQYQVYAGCAIAATGGTGPYTYTWAGASPWTGQQSPANGNYAALVEGLTEDPSTGIISGMVAGQGVYVVLFVVTDAAGTTVTQPVTFNIAGNNSMGGCSYPADSIYYQNISQLPVDNSPAAPIYSGYQSAAIRAGFGQYGNGPDGIPFYRVPYNQPMVSVNASYNLFPGAQGPIPFDAPMEGTRNGVSSNPVQGYTEDNHVLILQTAGGGKGCSEWDMYQVYPNYPNVANSWGDGLGDGQPGYTNGYWDMTGYSLVPQDNGAADAAGMPMIPFLENYDEVLGTGTPGNENGVIGEPKRFTLEHTLDYHVWPATSSAGLGDHSCSGGYEDYNNLLSQLNPPTSCGGPGSITGPMGEIYRLKASVATPACAATSPQARIIIQGFRDHGIILADNGISGMVIGTPDTRWDNNQLSCLGQLHLSDFEPVNVQSLAKNWPNSSQIVIPPPAPTSGLGATVTVTGIGKVTLMANQAGSGGYAPSAATVTFNVTGATPALTIEPIPTQMFGGYPIGVTANSNSPAPITYSLVSGPATIAGSNVTATGLGTIVVQASQAATGGYLATTATTSFNVIGTTPTLVFQTVPNQTFGVAPFNVTATSASPGPVTYSVVSGPATVSGNTVTLTAAGTVTLMASQAAVGDYAAATAQTIFNVNTAATSLNFAPVAAQTYGVAPFAVSASSNSPAPITYSVVSGPATISGSTVTVTGAGTVTLQASQPATATYSAATANVSFSVNGATPTLSFAAVAGQTFGAAPFAVSATSNSTGAITYSVVSGPATIAGNIVTLTAAGTVTLQASQAAAGGYNAATATTSFSVGGATPTLVFAAIAGQTFGAAPFAVSASSNSTGAITYSVVSGPATIAGNIVTLTGAGTVMLQASQAAAGGYLAGTATTSFVVSAAAPTLAFAAVANETFGAAPFAVSATSNSTGAITYSVVSGPATIAGNIVTLTGNGMVTLQASQAAAGGYLAATATTSFSVGGATPTLAFAAIAGQTFGAAPFAVSATSNSSGAITYSVVSGPASIAGNIVTLTGGGTVTLQASQAATGGYSAATATTSFIVSGATSSLAFAAVANQTYGAAPFAVTATSNSSGAISYSVVSGPATIAGNIVTLTGAGTVTLQASQAAAGGYIATTATTSFAVAGVSPTLSFSAIAGQTFGTAPFTVSATSNSPGAITYSVVSGPATIAGNTVTLTGNGTVTLMASQAAAGGYLAATATTSFSVGGATPTLTFAAIANQIFGAAPFAVSASSNSPGAITYSVLSGPATVAGNIVTVTGAGTVMLQASQAAAAGYNAATATTSFSVGAATPVLTFSAIGNQVYGVAPFAVTASSTSPGAVTYSVLSGPATISGNLITVTGTGTVMLQASQAAAAGFGAMTATTSFTVTAATPVLTFAAVANQTFGGAPFSVSATSNSTGAITYSVVSGPASVAGNVVTLTGAGAVTLQASQAAAGGFGAATATTSFTVVGATPTLSFAAVSNQTFGAAPFAVSATSNSNGAITYSVVSGPAAVAGNVVTLTGAGTVILQAGQAAAGGFNAATATTSFTVSAAMPTLSFAAVANPTFGAAPFAVSATSNSTGAITYSVVSGPASIAGNIVTLTGAGTVMLQANQAAAGGYAAAMATTSFTVSAAAPVLTFTPVANQVYGTAAFPVTASSTSPGMVTYTVLSGPATITGNMVTLTGPGTVTLQASQAAAAGYGAMTTTISFNVIALVPTLTFAAVPNQTSGAAPFTVSASSNSPGTISYSVMSGPATIAGNTVTLTGVGTVVLEASQAAAAGYAAATATTSFTVTVPVVPVGDFSLPTNFPAITITQGQTASFIVGITSVNKFAGTITLQCAVPTAMLPAECAATSAQLAAASTANSNITVMTTPSAVAAVESHGPLGAHARRLILLGLLAPFGLPMWRRRKAVWVQLMLGIVFAAGLAGCSGGVVQTTAAKGTYTVLVNATSGTISHSMNLTVIVQ